MTGRIDTERLALELGNDTDLASQLRRRSEISAADLQIYFSLSPKIKVFSDSKVKYMGIYLKPKTGRARCQTKCRTGAVKLLMPAEHLFHVRNRNLEHLGHYTPR